MEAAAQDFLSHKKDCGLLSSGGGGGDLEQILLWVLISH